ncbi:hypothetical protein BDV98DRAFT_591650 [Pterulicium gracile]|uniref:MARVEL domain-containing protein n=1 Tax=Pterulicium gracile TaxID=1884261 RepID=A0A5C3QLM5_9AGAR|nr:hypothetical protein BDV98DRAFT_591650 [Pterula gracilis]
MSFDSHVRRGHPVIFGLLIFFGIIELAISAWLVSRYNLHRADRGATERDRVRFTLFAAIWTVVISIFYLALFQHSASTGSVATSVMSHLIFLVLTWIIWTTSAAAVTQMLGGGLNCSRGYTYCGQLNALEAFAWIMWILTTFAVIVVIVRGIKASRRGDGMKGQLVSA